MNTLSISRKARKSLAITLSSKQLNMPISKLNVQLLRGLLLNVIGHYTLSPQDLEIVAITPADDLIVYKIKCASSDYPKINGRSGTSFLALKMLFKAMGVASGARIELILAGADRMNGAGPEREEGIFNPIPIKDTLEAVLAVLFEQNVPVEYETIEDVTAYKVTLPSPLSEILMASLSTLVELFGAKEQHKLYLAFR